MPSTVRGYKQLLYKIDDRFPKTDDMKISGKRYTLDTQITKLIVYSTCKTKLNITLWTMMPGHAISKKLETWELAPDMNVICLCRYRMSHEWADEWFRLEIEVNRESDTLALRKTPDLHRRWQAFVLADSFPLPLAETVAVTMGFDNLRKEDDMEKILLENESMRYVVKTNEGLLEKTRLSKSQKILLRFNVDNKNNCFCYRFTYRDNGHSRKSMDSKISLEDAFDHEYIAEIGEYFPWIKEQWASMCEDTYWRNTKDGHPVYDFKMKSSSVLYKQMTSDDEDSTD